MATFSITFKTPQNNKPISTNVKADDIKEAIQKLNEMQQNALILSYMQL